MIHRMYLAVISGLIFVLTLGPLTSARAEAVADFYSGRTITIVLGTGPGRTYDLYARLLAAHMPRHIPGNPNMVVQYMRGAGGLKATNYVFNAAPRDGTVIATLFASLPSLEKLRPKAAKYKSLEFNWLGAFSRIVNVIAVMSNAPATTLDDAKNKEVVIGSIGKANTTYQWPALINGILGTKFKIVSGYRSGGAIYKAMESGEVHGYSPVWLSLSATNAAWLRDKKVSVLAQMGLEKIDALPNTPMLIDLVKSDEDKALVKFLASGSPLGRSALTTPGVPADRLAALRKALAATVTDPAYLADAKARKLLIAPSSREAVEAAVRQIAATPEPLMARFKKIMNY